MDREEFLYLLPYLFSLALSLGVFLYTWRHRQVRGAKAYAWFVGGQTLTVLGFILELVSPHLQIKILWDKFQWLTLSYLVILPFLAFALQFSEHKLLSPRWTWGLWIALPALFTFFLLTDSVHHLLYPNPHLSTDQPFPELLYDFTIVVYVYTLVYIYGANLYCLSLLVRRAYHSHDLHRAQYLIIALGFFIPLALSVFSLANIRIAPQRDVSPFSLAIGNLIVAWGLFRYALFDIVPIAREHIVENIRDPVFVLDARNRVVDVNRAALRMVQKDRSEVIGHSAREIFAGWPEIVGELEFLDVERKEIAIQEDGDTFYYDINVSSIRGNQRQLIGRIVAARDITRYKTLESGYRLLSTELEQRVLERTEELRHSAELYRAVVENQMEFIVRWTADGMRTFVNDAYCRYFGLTFEEAVSSPFLQLVAEADRQVVEEKIQRLTSGVSTVETEVHRVIRPDGSIGWQEWTDQALRDKSGKIVEFQSVGRDITERKQAEEALLKSEERFSKAFQASPIIITITQLSTGKILEVNEAFEKVMGYRRQEAIGKTTVELEIWRSRADRDHVMSAFQMHGQLKNAELDFRTRNGSYITCYFSAELIELEGEKCLLSTIEDITDRKKAEARILRLNRLYATINQINQTIVRARDASSLFREICHVSTEHGQFRMAWIGLLDATRSRVEPVVFAGEELGYLEKVQIEVHNELTGRGPTGTAIREERCIISQDIANDPRMIPWREAALERGYGSSAAVPLREKGRVIGALTVYANESQGFDEEDKGLLEQIGQDVSFALDSINAEIKRERAEADLAEAYDTTLEGWAKALELRDKETEGHSRRVTETTVAVARALGFNDQELIHIRRGSILHDIGKMGIPDDILRKNGDLTAEERIIVNRHPITALNLLKPIAYLEEALDIPYCHHEKWDGTGYPRGLKGEEIPLSARIFAVVDVWDALSSDRPYRNAWPREKIEKYLIGESGKHFDPRVVNLFLQMVEKGEI
ncbi:MAG TPA: PAS domain S-box protein [Anaerolineales bacterium]|nr:PAS domain S-box protein [Anaerolineales bacterium]